MTSASSALRTAGDKHRVTGFDARQSGQADRVGIVAPAFGPVEFD